MRTDIHYLYSLDHCGILYAMLPDSIFDISGNGGSITVAHMQQSLTSLMLMFGLCSFSMRSNNCLVLPMYILGHNAQRILYIVLSLSCGDNKFLVSKLYNVLLNSFSTEDFYIEVKMPGFYNKLVKLVFVKTFKSHQSYKSHTNKPSYISLYKIIVCCLRNGIIMYILQYTYH